MEKKVQRQFRFFGFGFPVVMRDVPMVKVRGEWVPRIDWNEVERVMALAVSLKPARLTGNEVRFLRLHFGLSLEKFAQLFDYTKQGAISWEKTKDDPTHMKWPTEKDLRLHALARLDVPPKLFRRAFDALQTKRTEQKLDHRFDIHKLGEDQEKLVDELLRS